MDLGVKKLDKKFYKTMITIAIPIAIQNLISSSLNMIDNLMISRLGVSELASVSLANQFFFLFVLLLFGINSGAGIFISQFWGRKDIKNIRRVLGIALISGGILSLIFSGFAYFTPKLIMSIFIKDIEVINLGSKYLKIASISYVITSITFAFSFASRSIGHAKLPMVVTSISLGINTLLNYLLIFGNFYFPQLGVEGAAIATLISRIIELTILLRVIYKKGYILAANFSELFDITKSFLKRFFNTTTPVILNEAVWSLGMTMYAIAYARIGEKATASIQIANNIQNIFMVISMGLGNACAVMIGNQIGSDNRKKALDYAKKYCFIGPIVGLIIGGLLYLLSPVILYLFNTSSDVEGSVRKILLVMGIFMFIKVFNVVLIVGIFRGGGDTKFSLLLEAASVWLIGVPLAFLGAHIWNLPIYLVVLLVSFEEVVKAIIGIPRLISKKWVRNVVKSM